MIGLGYDGASGGGCGGGGTRGIVLTMQPFLCALSQQTFCENVLNIRGHGGTENY